MYHQYRYTHNEIPALVTYLVSLMPISSIIAFTGPLGAGKTTLVREMLHALNVREPITSPTFTYLNVYNNARGDLFYHFDLYRLTSLEQFLQAGFDEYLYAPGSWAFIEWPEVIVPLLKARVCWCLLEYSDNERIITIIPPGDSL